MSIGQDIIKILPTPVHCRWVKAFNEDLFTLQWESSAGRHMEIGSILCDRVVVDADSWETGDDPTRWRVRDGDRHRTRGLYPDPQSAALMLLGVIHRFAQDGDGLRWWCFDPAIAERHARRWHEYRGGNHKIPAGAQLPQLPAGWEWHDNVDHLVLRMPGGDKFCEISQYGDGRHWVIYGRGASGCLSADPLKCARVAASAARLAE